MNTTIAEMSPVTVELFKLTQPVPAPAPDDDDDDDDKN